MSSNLNSVLVEGVILPGIYLKMGENIVFELESGRIYRSPAGGLDLEKTQVTVVVKSTHNSYKQFYNTLDRRGSGTGLRVVGRLANLKDSEGKPYLMVYAEHLEFRPDDWEPVELRYGDDVEVARQEEAEGA
jgi:hypothetical protein